MKHLITFLSILLLAACANTPPPESTKFFKDVHYTVLETQKSEDPIVTQYFSFYCPHCKALEPKILQLKPHLLGEAKYEKIPVFFSCCSRNEYAAKAHAIMVLLDREDELVTPMFELAQGSNPPDGEQGIRNFFISHGISGSQFDQLYHSDEVKQMVEIYKQRSAYIGSVPTIIVNNKYLVDYPAFNDLNANDRNELIDYLLTL